MNRIKNSFNEIRTVVPEENALNKLVMAGFYEENNLLIDAITAYHEAMKLAPDVVAYKEAYDEFLYRNAIKERPVKK
jgi:cytochrome c-type biogenesis protein CcmH/NrfG